MLRKRFQVIEVLYGALAMAQVFTEHRDEETSAHLARMSRYARLIAIGLQEREGLSQEFVEQVYQFTPLHDVGKIAVPDRILLKPGKLTPEEAVTMRTHVDKGAHMIDVMIKKFRLWGIPNIAMLRNIIRYHHERWDGGGYPVGLIGDVIPLEARITSVADVFDALTSVRPYKPAWSFDQAAEFLHDQRGGQFDPDCVDALLARIDDVRKIHEHFDDSYED